MTSSLRPSYTPRGRRKSPPTLTFLDGAILAVLILAAHSLVRAVAHLRRRHGGRP